MGLSWIPRTQRKRLLRTVILCAKHHTIPRRGGGRAYRINLAVISGDRYRKANSTWITNHDQSVIVEIRNHGRPGHSIDAAMAPS